MNHKVTVGILLILTLVLTTAFFWSSEKEEKVEANSMMGQEVVTEEDEALKAQAIHAIRERLRSADYQRAYEMARVLYERDPKNPYGHYVTGLIELASGESLGGKRKLLDAIDLGLDSKDAATAYYNLGILAKKEGDSTKAAEYLKLAIKENPDDAGAKRALAELK